MDKEIVEKLLSSITVDTDRDALTVLYNAWVGKFGTYRNDTSKANLSEWQAAEKALKAKVEELESRYGKTRDAKPIENLLGVVQFLKANGYKIGKSKLYNDSKSGLIKINPDDTVNESEARAYAERYLKKIKSGPNDNGELDSIHKQKAEAELENIRMKNEKLQFDLERDRKEWMRREDVETRFAVILGTIEAHMKYKILSRAADWLTAAGGNSKKTDLMVDLMTADLDEVFNQLARDDELDVVIRMPDPEILSVTSTI